MQQSAQWQEHEALPPSGEALFEHLMTRARAQDSVVNEKTSATAAEPVKTLQATYASIPVSWLAQSLVRGGALAG